MLRLYPRTVSRSKNPAILAASLTQHEKRSHKSEPSDFRFFLEPSFLLLLLLQEDFDQLLTLSMSSSGAPSRKTLSKIATNRLQKELVEWQMNPPTGFKHKVTDNLQRWIIEVIGAPGTLYANDTYQLQVDFSEHYPMESPQLLCILTFIAMGIFV
ncbi:Ubiquitin-conjugating enzyme E2 [Arabidopsis thaliana x Arabidopsis arenosa]|uniref:Ubiquitin-conjugating enzyme E2 n=1 Tax=Arabidopsis thaliana x Arabidopsis arenosa TaxID=1240361 RepID=A0A8T2BUF1_9BRAS|nr:Ubiquitin-conjugating enzyme E2 [Arabidopsis thaliana x Arabidopsis arenosa]